MIELSNIEIVQVAGGNCGVCAATLGLGVGIGLIVCGISGLALTDKACQPEGSSSMVHTDDFDGPVILNVEECKRYRQSTGITLIVFGAVSIIASGIGGYCAVRKPHSGYTKV